MPTTTALADLARRLVSPTRRSTPEGGASPRAAEAGRDDPVLIGRVTLALVALGVAARLTRYLVQGAMWGDECFLGVNVVARDFAGLTKLLDYAQAAPVLFLWAEKAAFLLLGASELAMRLLPFLAGLAALFVFWDFARRAVSPLAAAFAVGALALARWPIYLAASFKPYSFDLLAAAVLVNLAHRWWTRPGRLGPLAALAAVVPLALAASYPSVFVAGAVSLYLLPTAWRHPDRRARALYVGYNALMFGAFLATYFLVVLQQLDPEARTLETFMRDYWRDGFPPAGPLAFLGWAVEINTGRMFAYPIGDSSGGSTLTLLLFLAGAWACWRTRRRALLVLCLTPFALNFVAAVAEKYPYGGCCRLSQHLAPAVCLLSGVGAAFLLERFAAGARTRARVLLGCAVVLAGFGIGQIAFDLVRPDRDQICRWSQRIGGEVRRQLKPGDRVVVASPLFMSDITLIYQLARLGDRITWDVAADVSDAPRVWVVVSHPGGIPHPYEAAAMRGWRRAGSRRAG